jgi:transposase-like protein
MNENDCVPYAGAYEDEIAYNLDTDKYDWRKLKVTCPSCKKQNAPLCSNKTQQLSGGWEWVGCSHQEPTSRHQVKCRHCKREYYFKLVSSQ